MTKTQGESQSESRYVDRKLHDIVQGTFYDKLLIPCKAEPPLEDASLDTHELPGDIAHA